MARIAPTVLCLAVIATACTTRVGVEFDRAEDFSGYHTWEWLPRNQPALRVRGSSAAGLHDLIVARVEHELTEAGFVPADTGAGADPPDFFITYHAEIQREWVVTTESSATQFVPSLSQSPSYDVGRSEKQVSVFERAHLVIDVADGRQRQLVWRGHAEGRVRGSFRPHLGGAVEEILDRFPPAADRALAARL